MQGAEDNKQRPGGCALEDNCSSGSGGDSLGTLCVFGQGCLGARILGRIGSAPASVKGIIRPGRNESAGALGSSHPICSKVLPSIGVMKTFVVFVVT